MIYIGVGIGGMLGSILRYYVSLASNEVLNVGFPFGTLLANLTGSLFLGWFTSNVIAQKKMNSILATSIGTGITGSFTTFSAFSLETVTLLETGRIGLAIFYILMSALGGLGLAAVGYHLGKKEINRESAG